MESASLFCRHGICEGDGAGGCGLSIDHRKAGGTALAGAEEFYEAFPVVYVEVINVLGVDDIGDAEAVALNDIGRSLHGDAHLGPQRQEE